jgi:hypothetical protein
MADTKKDFLEGYASGLEKQKGRYKSEGVKANKPLLDEEKVTAFRDKLRNPGKYADANFSPDPYSSGTIKGASDMATAIEKQREYYKKYRERPKHIHQNNFFQAPSQKDFIVSFSF